jgi:hypothetical protein
MTPATPATTPQPAQIVQPPSKNPSPRERFQSAPDNIRKHTDMVDRPEFQRALDFALLQFNRDQANGPSDQYSKMCAGIASEAVEDFILILRTLAEPPVITKIQRISDHLPELKSN